MMYRSMNQNTHVFGDEMVAQFQTNDTFGPNENIRLLRVERYVNETVEPIESIIYFRIIYQKSEIP